MSDQSTVLKGLHSAIDELEILLIEAENLDLDIVEGLMERFDKLQKTLKEKQKK